MLSHKKQKQPTSEPRPPLGMSLVKLNSFLFKKQKQKQAESMEIPKIPKNQDISYTNNKSLRIRFKSEIIQFNSSPDQIKTKNSAHLSNAKQPPYNLTLRILKWSKLKRKNSGKKFDYHLFKDKIRGKEISDKSDIEIIKEINMDRKSRKSTQNNSVPKQKFFWNQSETMKIIDSYKLTQRIVFYEQLQQKKDKQRYSQTPQKSFHQQIKNGSRVLTEKEQRIKVCRPWSGESVQTEAHHG